MKLCQQTFSEALADNAVYISYFDRKIKYRRTIRKFNCHLSNDNDDDDDDDDDDL